MRENSYFRDFTQNLCDEQFVWLPERTKPEMAPWTIIETRYCEFGIKMLHCEKICQQIFDQVLLLLDVFL